MKNGIIILHVALIAIIVLANTETNTAAYTLNLADIPASMRTYAEENPDSFAANVNDLLGQGYSESEAFSEMERRLAFNLDRIETEKENARFLKEVEAVPNIQRAMVVQNPELYKAAKRKLASGLPVNSKEQALLGIMKDGDGLYRPISRAHPHHLRNERAYANSIIQYNQAVADIQSMMQWLRGNCPPREMPAVNPEHADEEKPLDERSRLAQTEKSRIEIHYGFYKQQTEERAAVQRRLKSIETQLGSIERRLAKIEEKQHWH